MKQWKWLILFGGIIVILICFPTPSGKAQEPAPTLDPAPTIQALELQIEALKLENSQIKATMSADARSEDLIIREVRQEIRGDLLEPLIVISLVFIVAGSIGGSTLLLAQFKSMRERRLNDYMVRRADQLVAEAFYQVDALRSPIFVPATGFENERRKLLGLGFTNIETYDAQSSLPNRGIVIAVTENGDQVNEIKRKLDDQLPRPNEMGIILFTRGAQIEAIKDFDKTYSMYISANYFGSMITHIYALSRLLR